MARYRVNIDVKWSENFNVLAKNAREAREKAFELFVRRMRKSKVSFYVDKIED